MRNSLRPPSGRGKKPSPSVGIIDSQSVKSTEAGGPRDYDGGKKVSGRKRHVLVDTLGLLLAVVITPANVHDYDAAKLVFDKIGRKSPAMKTIYADSSYVYKGLVRWLYCHWLLFLEIVKRPSKSRTFQVLPKRWIVERTLVWLSRRQRLSKD